MAENKDTLDRIRKRKESRSTGKSTSGSSGSGSADTAESIPFHRQIRGWIDALFLAFLFAMFIRLFVFELFMIPTGSMTPALIGDDARVITEADWDGDGQDDIIVNPPGRGPKYLQAHLRDEDGNFERMIVLNNVPDSTLARFFNQENKGKGRRDMIMVNKFSYWFSGPKRGDIAVFKVPDRPNHRQAFDVTKPVYIKRVAALPEEDLVIQTVEPYEVRPPGHPDRVTPDNYAGVELEVFSKPLLVDGKPVEEELYDRLHHFPTSPMFQYFGRPDVEEDYAMPADDQFTGYVMLGDNQSGSSDSRIWGRVPFEHVRGKAILRYNPFRAFGFLEHAD